MSHVCPDGGKVYSKIPVTDVHKIKIKIQKQFLNPFHFLILNIECKNHVDTSMSFSSLLPVARFLQ